MSSAEEILNFWFGNPQTDESRYEKRRKLWFAKNPSFDQELRDRFLPIHQQAVDGKLDDWQQVPKHCLALIVTLDQFSRNIFRGKSGAFAADAKALAIAKGAIDRRFDQALDPIQRIFVYLPLEHSENLDDQNQSVAFVQELTAANPEFDDILDYAIRHRDVIKRFGRFPHRNAILGRVSTPEEIEFLKQPGSSF